jgi:hypothetical protein
MEYRDIRNMEVPMLKRVALTVLVAAGTLAALPVVTTFQPAAAQAWGDRDRDGVPNAFDPHNNRPNPGRGDKDRDGVPNRYDRYDNRPNQAWGDRDRDGVPNAYDRHNNQPRPNQAWGDRDRDGIPNVVDPSNNRRFQ